MITLGVFVFALFTEREDPDDVDTFGDPTHPFGAEELVSMKSFLKSPSSGKNEEGHAIISMPQKSL
jgi:hypothetical protein